MLPVYSIVYLMLCWRCVCNLKYILSGNTSVLRWWFRDLPVSLVTSPESLIVGLTLSDNERVWFINVTGKTH